MDELNKIVYYYPEIIFLPNPVKTWKGFIIVESPSNSNVKERIKVKLVVPNYPEMSDSEISFGPQIAIINKAIFKKKITDALKNATSVLILLQQIETTIVSLFPFNNDIISNDKFDKQDLIEQLQQVLSDLQEVTIYSRRNLEEIILTVKQITMTLKWKNMSWEIISSDLPQSLSVDIMNRKLTLKDIIIFFIQSTEQMAEAWQQLEEIDLNCHVMDPKEPKPYHLYRRIYLTDYLSIHITLDPLNATACPDIKFLGSELYVQEFKDRHMDKINDWNPNITVYDNLLNLLVITEFPHPEEKEVKTQNACFENYECCICFSFESENGAQPEKTCPNTKCAMVFHSSCLLKWLECDGLNKVVFGEIYGKCPHCEESISCAVLS